MVYVGPGTFHLGPGSKVKFLNDLQSRFMVNRANVVYSFLHGNTALQISTDATLIVGNSSVLVILTSKTVSIGGRNKLGTGDHMYCLVFNDVHRHS